jgi:hypothetical protein
MASLGPLGAGGGGGGGGSAGGVGAGCAAACGRRRTSVPCTGHRQVVPLYGILSALPFSSIVASLVTENEQTGRPGSVPDPFIVMCALLPLTVPFAEAEITSVPHVAVNVPAMFVAVCVAI